MDSVKIHIKETHTDPVYGSIFEGWMTGENLSAFGDLAHTHCAMTLKQAIDYHDSVKEIAYKKGVELVCSWDEEELWESTDETPTDEEIKKSKAEMNAGREMYPAPEDVTVNEISYAEHVKEFEDFIRAKRKWQAIHDAAQKADLQDREGDFCTRCGNPIDHNDPHMYCSNCT